MRDEGQSKSVRDILGRPPWPDFSARPPCFDQGRKGQSREGKGWRRASEARKLVPFPCVLVMTGGTGNGFGGVSKVTWMGGVGERGIGAVNECRRPSLSVLLLCRTRT